MIYHGTPWSTGNIGAGLNAFVERLPDDAWVCLRDGDTLFLTPEWGRQVEQVAEAHPSYDVIGAMTNRLRAPYQLHDGRISDEADIGKHIDIANQRWDEHGTTVQPVDGPVAGMFLLFRKSTWERARFAERSIYFDKQFCTAVRRQGGRIGVALGLYLFHLYRWGQLSPTGYTAHLS